jgi:predicted lipid-binding transport protein (Tim44 family)
MAFDANRPANESGSMIGSAIPGSATASGVGGAQNWSVPADFDTAGFLSAAKANFVSLQDAWDRSDIAALRVMMTDAMLEEIKTQLADRETHTGTQPNKTEVVMLDAQLLGIEDLGQGYMASVEFSGMVREEPTAGPSAFREVWNMTKSKGGGGWLVAGVQALQ